MNEIIYKWFNDLDRLYKQLDCPLVMYYNS